jgi:DNA-binding NarL/FixJ family response regulator
MISVIIVDDHPVVLHGLAVFLAAQADVTLLAHCSNAQQVIDFCNTTVPDVVITDISMPDISGIELCKQLVAAHPTIAVIALSTFNRGKFICEMMASGAKGYLSKDAHAIEILKAITQVAQGNIYMNPEIEKVYKQTLYLHAQLPVLTRREKEVLPYLAQGLNNAEISKQLFISTDTVDSHRKHLYAKFNVNSATALMKFIMDNDI